MPVRSVISPIISCIVCTCYIKHMIKHMIGYMLRFCLSISKTSKPPTSIGQKTPKPFSPEKSQSKSMHMAKRALRNAVPTQLFRFPPKRKTPRLSLKTPPPEKLLSKIFAPALFLHPEAGRPRDWSLYFSQMSPPSPATHRLHASQYATSKSRTHRRVSNKGLSQRLSYKSFRSSINLP